MTIKQPTTPVPHRLVPRSLNNTPDSDASIAPNDAKVTAFCPRHKVCPQTTPDGHTIGISVPVMRTSALGSPTGQSTQFKATFFVILGAFLGSLFALMVDVVPQEGPFLFTASLLTGDVMGTILFCLIFHRNLFRQKSVIRFFAQRVFPINALWARQDTFPYQRHRMFAWLVIWGTFARFFPAIYIWSTYYIDTAITAILISTWPILQVLILSRQSRGLGRYNRIGGHNLALLLFAFTGIAFVVLGTGDPTTPSPSAGSHLQLFGMALAVIAAISASLHARHYKWAYEVNRDTAALERPSGGTDGRSLELLCAVVIHGVTSLGGCLVLVVIGGLQGESITFGTWMIGVGYGVLVSVPAVLSVRQGIILTKDLMVNIIFYTVPLMSLLWLALFTDIVVDRLDLVVIGACAVLSVNLLLNLDPEHRPGRFGFKTLILSLWTFGTFVYLRDRWVAAEHLVWQGGDYWTLVALSATVFTLILSFRISRLVTRTRDEESKTVVLLRKLERLADRKVLDSDVMQILRRIHTAGNVDELKTAYGKMRLALAAIRHSQYYTVREDEMTTLEGELDALVHSKQYGREFSELVAVIVFGGVTVALTLFNRPEVAGWGGFMTEMFMVVLASTVAFLVVNLADMRRERKSDIFKHDGLLDVPGYAVFFRTNRYLALERVVSLAVGFALAVAVGVLLYIKWVHPLVYSNWAS